MKKELSPLQIEKLFEFCSKHFVRFYDLQVELVDHLANAIEEKMDKQKDISFETALDEVHKSFGYKGFAGFVEARVSALYQQNKKQRRKLFLEYFTFPKIAFTTFLIICFITIGTLVPKNQLGNVSAIFTALFILLELIVAFKSRRLFKRVTKNLLLISSRYNQSMLSFFALQFLIQYLHFSDKNELSILNYSFFSITIGLMIIATLSYYDLCKKLLKFSFENYPQAFAK
jgi:hypothetical protein